VPNLPASTYREIVFPLRDIVAPLSPWQERQSAFPPAKAGEQIRRRKPEIRTKALNLAGMKHTPCTTVSVMAVENLNGNHRIRVNQYAKEVPTNLLNFATFAIQPAEIFPNLKSFQRWVFHG
jgi:hypothetical protein